MSSGKGLKRILITFAIVLVVLSAALYFGIQFKLNELNKVVSKIEIKTIDLSELKDGEYIGKYYVNESAGATVKVTIEGNKIINIGIVEHKCARGKKAEIITNSVINRQSLDVDTISGATSSSLVILKAIENALTGKAPM